MKQNLEIVVLPLDSIVANQFQPRKNFDERELKELAESIKSYGVIQPVVVRKNDELYELVVGERRYRASKLIGNQTIPAILVEMQDNTSAVVALVENIQRQNLCHFEEADAIRKLIDENGFNQKTVAIKLGKNQSTVSNKLRLLKLPYSIRTKLVENSLSERHARSLLKLKDEKQMFKVLNSVIKNELSVKDTEKRVSLFLEANKEIEVEEKTEKKKFKFSIDHKIYLNTIKQACKTITDTGADVNYKEKDTDDYVEVVIRIPKKKM